MAIKEKCFLQYLHSNLIWIDFFLIHIYINFRLRYNLLFMLKKLSKGEF